MKGVFKMIILKKAMPIISVDRNYAMGQRIQRRNPRECMCYC